FSSSRRHMSFSRDWSSDVCSSDLLAPSDVDLQIETLVFEADGTFSVTWRNGGAHTTGIPHVFVPDYRGRYNISPESGSIEMHFRSEERRVGEEWRGGGAEVSLEEV